MMAWVSDELLALYRQLNASYLVIAETVQILGRSIRRAERRIEDMVHTVQESLDAVRETRGMVASLVKLTAELRDKVNAVPGLTPEQQAAVDEIFDDAHDSTSQIAKALVANPAPNDSATNPAPTPPPAPDPAAG